ncbi:MAG: serine/threonine protein kinase [Arenicellales bacterium]|nr:serine/threonine protein kinase [Arenicellales bacterium]
MTATDDLAYQNLDPDAVLAAVESQGHVCDGHLLILNSYENRVYQVGIDNGSALIAKFYRPGRWDDETILEEHAFSLELAAGEVSLIPPIQDPRDQTLFRHGGHRFALFPSCGGRPPNLEDPEHQRQLGRFLGRLHAVGMTRRYAHRPVLDVDTFGVASVQFLLDNDFIPTDLEPAYRSLTEDLLQQVRWCYERAGPIELIRLHGDCHTGNILWTDDGPHLVDLDDSRTGPAIQDLWMFLSGDRQDQESSLNTLLEGYSQFCEFSLRELHLIEALRTLRMMHHYAWLARRWRDPAFPRAFPWFNSQRCWEQHILDLREQAPLMVEPPLATI